MIKNITLTSSMRSNLASLKNIATQMEQMQNILSTGKKINSAIDNATSYYQARSLSNRAKDLNSLLDSMGQGIQTLQAANEGIESATIYMKQLKSVVEQALLEEAKPLTSQVQLTDNVSELLAQGYHAIDSSMTSTDINNLITTLKNNNEKIELVLIENIELDGLVIDTSNVILNGGGHTITLKNSLQLKNSNITIENMNIEANMNYHVIHANSYSEGTILRNVNINYNGDFSTIYELRNATLENININSNTNNDVIVSYGDLNIKNLTMNLTGQPAYAVRVVGDTMIDGMSINTNNDNTIGLSVDGNVTGLSHLDQIISPELSVLTDGKTNTQAIVDQLGEDAKAAYATTQFYVGDKNGEFGQGNWYLPSIGELMELCGTNYDAISGGHGASGYTGENLTIINDTLTELNKDGIAEKMVGWYWSSSEYNSNQYWDMETISGSRYSNNKDYYGFKVRPFLIYENCFNPTSNNIPQVGDIIYQDGTWGTIDEYKLARNPSSVVGVISDVGDDGSVTIISLKNLRFSSENDDAIFDPENPYNGAINGTSCATTDRGSENIEAIIDVDKNGLVAAFNGPKKYSIEVINNAFAQIDSSSFNKILNEYNNLIYDASYQGVNLLNGGNLTVTLNETRNHKIDIAGVDAKYDALGIKTIRWKNLSDIKKSLNEVTEAVGKLREYSENFGNQYQIIQTRQNFTDALSDVLEVGADKLVLADMNEASAEYLMLQTRQQLAVNSLSLASQSAKSVLNLF